TRGSRVDVNASYVRSTAAEDLNALITFVDPVLEPIVGANQYAPSAASVPNRLFVLGRVRPTAGWLFVGSVDSRSGLPYSIVDESLEFVGQRNAQRFPVHVRSEIGFDRRI